MLDLAYLRENIETARQRLAHRGFSLDVETFQRLDGERKKIIQDVERMLRTRCMDEMDPGFGCDVYETEEFGCGSAAPRLARAARGDEDHDRHGRPP